MHSKGLRAGCYDVGQHSLCHVTVPQKVDFIRNSQIPGLVEESVLSAVKSWSGAFFLCSFFFFLTSVCPFISAFCLFTVMIRVISSVHMICINVFFSGKMKLLKLSFILKESRNDKLNSRCSD